MVVGHISAETAHFLFEDYPIEFVLLDVRRRDEVASFGKIEYAINLPLSEWETGFSLSESEFESQYCFHKPKLNDNIILCSLTGERRSESAAEILEKLGYTRITIITGGIREYSRYYEGFYFYEFYPEGQDPPIPVSITLQETNYPWVATQELHNSHGKFTILDLRRKDEIEHFGIFPNALNLPTEECMRAAQTKASDWEKEYGFARPQAGQQVLLYCRSNRRAKFVYKVLRDAGWENEGIKLQVFKEGVAGLSRLSPHVKAYEAFEEGAPFPPVIPPVDPLY